jgi:hypothetical protein
MVGELIRFPITQRPGLTVRELHDRATECVDWALVEDGTLTRYEGHVQNRIYGLEHFHSKTPDHELHIYIIDERFLGQSEVNSQGFMVMNRNGSLKMHGDQLIQADYESVHTGNALERLVSENNYSGR